MSEELGVSEAIDRLVESQKPFFTALTNQVEGMDKRLLALNTTVWDMSVSLSAVNAGDIKRHQEQQDKRLDDLELRVEALEKDQHKREGMAAAIHEAPKVLLYLGIIVAMVLGYVKMAGTAGIKLP